MSERRSDSLTPALAARYAATFDREPRATGPQGIHWCLNTPETPTGGLGDDGHPRRDEHADLPRRMWAASAMTFHAPIRVGAEVARMTHVEQSVPKDGKTGRMLFVTVAHEITADGALAVSERQTIVYRPAPAPGTATPPAPPMADEKWSWERKIAPTPPLLFRYSALTFNSHRIHYDLPYAQHEEGYPGLVVHGPLMAGLLLDLADRELGPDPLSEFSFRAVSPAFAGQSLRLLGRTTGSQLEMAVARDDGGTIMTAAGTIR